MTDNVEVAVPQSNQVCLLDFISIKGPSFVLGYRFDLGFDLVTQMDTSLPQMVPNGWRNYFALSNLPE